MSRPELYPPLLYGRTLPYLFGKYFGHQRISIDGHWANLMKCFTQGYGLENTDPRLLPEYQKMGLAGHDGFDLLLFPGDPVIASHDGVVSFVGADTKGGLGVTLWNKELKYKTLYWHNQINLVIHGQEVKAGDLLAYGDSTGFSTDHHLHWGIKLTDEVGNTINNDNGYRGWIDPMPYLMDNMKLTREDVELLYKLVFNREADSGAQGYVGQDLSFVLKEFEKSEEYKNQTALVEAARHL